ncbi:MAG: SLC13 family permease [Syntrophomonadaceae bacterium]|nr:SLC13 family permease [Syntrophomonadaceae bacterium]
MTLEQIIIMSILLIMLLLLIWGKWRYDLVAMVTLLIVTIIGIVPASEAFSGFGHPAVITVAAILVVSKGLINSGIVGYIAGLMNKVGENYLLQLLLLVGAVIICSAFMNNIAALALFLPVAIRIARRNDKSPSLYLMPLAFGSLLGGLMTLVGTPPNIIISSYRAEALQIEPFGMFDFIWVGGGVALVGLVFILLYGWRLIPQRQAAISNDDLLKEVDYITALQLTDNPRIELPTLAEIEIVSDGNVAVISHVRDGEKQLNPSPNNILRPGDTIIVEGEPDHLQEIMDYFGLRLAEADKLSEKNLTSDQISVIEATVTPNSRLIGETASSLRLRAQFGVNLLGMAREGTRLSKNPNQIRIRAGDVLLLQGATETLQEVLPILGCLPLAARDIRIGKRNRLLSGVGIFITVLIVAVLDIMPVQIAFMAGAAAMVIAKSLTLREAYESVEWPIIILLGALIPVSQAFETTGSADVIAQFILGLSLTAPPWATLMILLGATLLLSNVVNNAAAALIMAPIAVNMASGLGSTTDPFLMAVAVGASCAFLTPIGHQSNLLVMGPGGYKFGDYWRLGLPLTLLVLVVATPLILLFWPL